MSEYGELVKRLNELLQATYGERTDLGYYVSMSADQWGRINAERTEAAQAIERLEREIEITKASLTDAEKAERELAEARARERQKDRALERIGRPMDCGCNPCRGQCRSQEALQIEIDAIKDEANEALADPAPAKGKDSEGKE